MYSARRCTTFPFASIDPQLPHPAQPAPVGEPAGAKEALLAWKEALAGSCREIAAELAALSDASEQEILADARGAVHRRAHVRGADGRRRAPAGASELAQPLWCAAQALDVPALVSHHARPDAGRRFRHARRAPGAPQTALVALQDATVTLANIAIWLWGRDTRPADTPTRNERCCGRDRAAQRRAARRRSDMLDLLDLLDLLTESLTHAARLETRLSDTEDPMRHRPDPDQLMSSGADCDRDLVRQVLSGGLPGEHAGLELLLRHRPTCWEHAVPLLAPDRASRDALATLRHAWRTCGRIETPATARTR